jgi:hypothetical protein
MRLFSPIKPATPPRLNPRNLVSPVDISLQIQKVAPVPAKGLEPRPLGFDLVWGHGVSFIMHLSHTTRPLTIFQPHALAIAALSRLLPRLMLKDS